MLTAALAYAVHGLAVLPLWPINLDGRCACGTFGCKPGKHPLTSLVPHGVSDATADTATITQWWSVWPDANIGVRIGERYAVLDVDVQYDGDQTLARLIAEHGLLPQTARVKTGGHGGTHYWYRVSMPIRARTIAPGIELKHGNLYVVVPPSRAPAEYLWLRRGPVAMLPCWLSTATTRWAEPVPEAIREGERNTTLASLAGSLRYRGLDAETIAEALLVVNRRRCRPPLPDEEARRIAASVARYDARDPRVFLVTPRASNGLGLRVRAVRRD